jgi:hypothetical protein
MPSWRVIMEYAIWRESGDVELGALLGRAKAGVDRRRVAAETRILTERDGLREENVSVRPV